MRETRSGPRCTTLLHALATALVASSAAAQPAPSDSAAAAAHFAAGRWSDALAAYAALLGRDSSHAFTLMRYGASLQATGRNAEAVPVLRAAVARNAPAGPARWRLAKALAALGNRAGALAQLDTAARAGAQLYELARGDADLAAVRADPGFAPVLARLEAVRFPCRADPVVRQLDFWVGDWSVRAGGVEVGLNRVHPVVDRCALLENWEPVGAAGGQSGKSLTYVDPQLGRWKQVFIFDGGRVNDYTGEWRDGAMRFVARIVGPDGRPRLQRMTFTPVARDTVTQAFEASTDGGVTWGPASTLVYVRRAGGDR